METEFGYAKGKLREWVRIQGSWYELVETSYGHVTIWLGCQHCLVNKSLVEGYRMR